MATLRTKIQISVLAAVGDEQMLRMLITGSGFVARHFRDYFAKHYDVEHATNLDYIIHLKEFSDIDASIRDPITFFEENIERTLKVLDVARGSGHLKRLVYLSTDEVLGPVPHGERFAEDRPYNAQNPYAASKAAGEQMVMAWSNTYGIPVLILRCQNLIGEGQPRNKFVPSVVRALLKGESVKLYSDGVWWPRRDFLHVEDAASAMDFLISRLDAHPEDFLVPLVGGGWSSIPFNRMCSTWHVARPEPFSTVEVVDRVAKILRVSTLTTACLKASEVRPGFHPSYGLNGERLLGFGWTPRPFEESLERTVKWFVEHQ